MYRAPETVSDEATPYLVPLAAALASVAFWTVLFALAFPWDWIPADVTCHDEVIRSFFGRVKDVRRACVVDSGPTAMVVLGMIAWTGAATLLAITMVVRALTRDVRTPRAS